MISHENGSPFAKPLAVNVSSDHSVIVVKSSANVFETIITPGTSKSHACPKLFGNMGSLEKNRLDPTCLYLKEHDLSNYKLSAV